MEILTIPSQSSLISATPFYSVAHSYLCILYLLTKCQRFPELLLRLFFFFLSSSIHSALIISSTPQELKYYPHADDAQISSPNSTPNACRTSSSKVTSSPTASPWDITPWRASVNE